MQHTMEYVKGDKKYRKHPERYIRDKKWEDEIVDKEVLDLKLFKRDSCGFPMAYCEKCGSSESYTELEIKANDSKCCSAKLLYKKGAV